VTALDGKLYTVGGRWGDAGNLAALEIYDPAAGTWTRGPDLPTPRSGLTASVLKGRIHVVGGESLSLSRTFGEHEAYDPSSKAWSTLADLPTPRHGLASAAAGGRWYVIGGGEGRSADLHLTDRSCRGIPRLGLPDTVVASALVRPARVVSPVGSRRRLVRPSASDRHRWKRFRMCGMSTRFGHCQPVNG
jgi:hypothetical protein